MATSIKLVSTDANGVQGNDDSGSGSISADGHYVVFASDASNLVLGDTNGSTDVFRKDVLTGLITRVSTDANSNQGNGFSGRPSISADGRYVVFASDASNLVPGDTNGSTDVFRKDVQTGVIIRVSTDANNNQANGRNDLSVSNISGDGRYVVFASDASNLVPDDTISKDVFRKDVQTGAITRLSTDKNFINIFDQTISADGGHVAFSSYSLLMPAADLFLRDLSTGGITRV